MTECAWNAEGRQEVHLAGPIEVSGIRRREVGEVVGWGQSREGFKDLGKDWEQRFKQRSGVM